MKKLITIFAAIFGVSSQVNSDITSAYDLDYEKMIFLDAETLAEQGVLDAYEELKPELSKHVGKLASVKELLDNDIPSYKVTSQGETFDIYGPELEENEGQSWGRATYAFFKIINRQLHALDIKFYAINGGHDLGGMFLTSSQYEAAVKSIPRKTDWPYIPKVEHPWYGQPN